MRRQHPEEGPVRIGAIIRQAYPQWAQWWMPPVMPGPFTLGELQALDRLVWTGRFELPDPRAPNAVL